MNLTNLVFSVSPHLTANKQSSEGLSETLVIALFLQNEPQYLKYGSNMNVMVRAVCFSVSLCVFLFLCPCPRLSQYIFILFSLSYKVKGISAMSECREDLLARSHPVRVNSTPLPIHTHLKCFSI